MLLLWRVHSGVSVWQRVWVDCHWTTGLQGCQNRPAPFPGRMSYKATKPGLICLSYFSTFFTVLLFIRAPFYILLVFVSMCAVFWLFWFSYQYLPSDWLERLLWGSVIVTRGSSPESPSQRVCDFLGLLYCFIEVTLNDTVDFDAWLYQIITLSTQLPFVNDAVYIILTELLFNAIAVVQ